MRCSTKYLIRNENILKKDFYIYEWYNVDTNEVFYVGKGRLNRYKNIKQRNNYFNNYYNKYNCNVRKVKTEMEENEAFELEIKLIAEYRMINQAQCNLTNGGEGCTFPLGSWNDMFRRLQYSNIWGNFSIMNNEEDYSSENLKTKTLEELHKLYENYSDEVDGNKWFKSLDVYNDNGELNIGWECFED